MKTLIQDETNTTTTLDTQDKVKEAIVGEELTISLAGSLITALEAYDGAPEITEAGSAYTFTASTPGLYRLKATSAAGVRQVLIRVVERSVLEAIPDPGFRTGYGHSTTPRLALRSIVNNVPDWDGTADAFWTNKVKLADHGIVVPQV